jgi:hypothetical protein
MRQKNTRQQDRAVESGKANEGEREDEIEQGKTTRRHGNGGQKRKVMERRG